MRRRISKEKRKGCLKALLWAVLLGMLLPLILQTVTVFVAKTFGGYGAEEFDDSDLLIEFVPIAPEKNSLSNFMAAVDVMCWPTNRNGSRAEIPMGSQWNTATSAVIIASNEAAFALIEQGLAQGGFQIGDWTNEFYGRPYGYGLRHVGQLLHVRAESGWRTLNSTSAYMWAFKCMDYGQLVQEDGGPVGLYAYGAGFKVMGADALAEVIRRWPGSNTDMQTLQRRIGRYRKRPDMIKDGLRADYSHTCRLMEIIQEKGYSEVFGYIDDDEAWIGELVFGYMLNQVETKRLKASFARPMLKAIDKPFKDTKKVSDETYVKFEAMFNAEPILGIGRAVISGNLGGIVLVGMMGSGSWGMEILIKSAANEECAISSLETLTALKRYQAEEGELPNTLADLVPTYLEEVPRDAYDGKPMRYNPTNAVIYSVGQDLIDNHGDTNWPSHSRAGVPERFRAPDVVFFINP